MINSVPTFGNAIYDCAQECAAQCTYKMCRNNFDYYASICYYIILGEVS